MNHQSFVISLRSSPERCENVARLIRESPLPCVRWNAVDGRLLTAAQIAQVYRRKLHQPRYPFELKPGEIGCFLSHQTVWQRMLDDSIDGALILEDDVEPSADFVDALRLAVETAASECYVQFQTRKLGGGHVAIASRGNRNLVRPKVVPLRTTAQWVTLAAARRLLRLTDVFDRPIDTFLQMRWLHGVDILTVSPPCVREISRDLGGSVVNSESKPPLRRDFLSREWKRYFYRNRVRRMSQAA